MQVHTHTQVLLAYRSLMIDAKKSSPLRSLIGYLILSWSHDKCTGLQLGQRVLLDFNQYGQQRKKRGSRKCQIKQKNGIIGGYKYMRQMRQTCLRQKLA